MRLTVEVIPTGKTTATIILEQDQVDRIRGSAGRGRVPVVITFRGTTYRTSVSIYRGQWMTVVNKEMREGGLVPGSSYAVDISADVGERTVDVPKDLAAALKKAGLRSAFDALSYTYRKEHVRAVEEAKKPETRERRIASVVEKVGAGGAQR
ncbi:MAG: YdeI/OmpD-associated family protein [Candidatus Nanopelagicales bacterium]